MKHKSQLNFNVILIIFCLVLSTGLSAQKSFTADFEVTKQCLRQTVLDNTSTYVQDTIIGYLWEITEENGQDTVITTTESPILSFDPTGNYSNENKISYKFKLTALTDGHGEKSTTKIIGIYKSPQFDIRNWDDLVCSNADSTFYEIEPENEFSYSWDITNIPGKYILESSGKTSNRLKIVWGKLEDNEGTIQFELGCTITSSEADGMCDTYISDPVILLSSSVPVSENLQIVAKTNDNSTLFCIIDNPENYYYEWGYEKSNGEIHKEVKTEENYFRWENGIIESRKYFVEILSKDFTYCTTTVIYEKEKSGTLTPIENTNLIEVLNLYPNPATEQVHIDLMKNSDTQESVSISIFNFMGSLESTHRFELTDKISSLSIPVRFLSSGHYFLRFDVSNSRSIVKKFVVIKN